MILLDYIIILNDNLKGNQNKAFFFFLLGIIGILVVLGTVRLSDYRRRFLV